MPVLLPCSSERLVRYGLFLLEDGHSIFLWIGRDAVPQLLMDVFGQPSYDQLPLSGKVRHSFTLLITSFVVLPSSSNSQITLPTLNNPFSKRVNAIIDHTRTLRRGPYWPQLYLVREDGDMRLRMWVLSMLMLDRADQAPSYQQFLITLREKVRPCLATSVLFLSIPDADSHWFVGLWILTGCFLLEHNGMEPEVIL